MGKRKKNENLITERELENGTVHVKKLTTVKKQDKTKRKRNTNGTKKT